MGDFSANFHRPESGIHTVEGTISGSRAAFLEKKRQREQEEFEKKKKQILLDKNNSLGNIDKKFAQQSSSSITEKAFKEQTVGLVTAKDFKEKAKAVAEAGTLSGILGLDGSGKATATTDGKEKEDDALSQKKKKKKSKKKLKEKKKMLSTLSFNFDDGEEEEQQQQEQAVEEEEEESKMSRLGKIKSKKDPTIDTSFLPDAKRDELIQKERLRLEQEWKEKQIEIKKESLEITYSYWDGSGHRRKVIVKKGDSIGDFLELVRNDLCLEFREMKTITSGSDALLYVKEDLILPNDITFYDLIVTKARGKSGPLFHFDVHDDVRVGAIDSRIEKDESHPGKVVERRWYDRNKHIFPASRWEVYNPAKRYGKYTIGDINKRKT